MSRALALRLFPGLFVTVLAGLLLAVDSIAAPGGGRPGFSGAGASGGDGELSPWVLFVVGGLVLFVVFRVVRAARLRRRDHAARVALASAALGDDPEAPWQIVAAADAP